MSSNFKAVISYLFHSGFALEYEDYFLIFDYYKPPENIMDSGFNKKDLENGLENYKHPFVFVSHGHYDHFNPNIFDWKSYNTNITYIVSNDVLQTNDGMNIDDKHSDVRCFYMSAYEKMEMHGIDISTFGSTDIGVSLWIISNNKNERFIEIDNIKTLLRDRREEILFMDLRQIGVPFEKKYIEFSPENLKDITKTYHKWQSKDEFKEFKNIPEFCYSASKEEVVSKNFSLVPSEYIEFINNDENVDYDKRMKKLTHELRDLMMEEEQSKEELLDVLKELGYEIEL